MKNCLKSFLPPAGLRLMRLSLSFIGESFLEKYPKESIIFSSPDHHVFFGYYDISPFDRRGKKILAGRSATENISPHIHHPVLELGYYNLDDDKRSFNKFAETLTWNWQQGCRMQWYPDASADSSLVIYNTICSGSYGSVIHDIRDKKIISTLSHPIYSVSSDGRWALSLDFDRLHKFRPGYGYNNLSNPEPIDGVILMDIQTGSARNILSLSDIMSFDPVPGMNGAQHYLNHLCFSPSGKKFLVMHLWVGVNEKRYSRILIVDREGRILFCPSKGGCVSHYCWFDENRILLFSKEDGVFLYYLYDIDKKFFRPFGGEALKNDGHPSFLCEGEIITDTYPDIFRIQPVIIYSSNDGRKTLLSKLHSPIDYVGEIRCDLHPRVRYDLNLFSVDVVRNNRRSILLSPIGERRK